MAPYLWFPLFLVCVSAAAAGSAAAAWRLYTRVLDRVAFALLLLFVGIYAISTTAGAINRIGVWGYAIGCGIWLAAMLVVAAILPRPVAAEASLPIRVETTKGRAWATIVAGVVAAVAAAPIVVNTILIHPLQWDVMTYGLWSGVHAWHTHTLWRLDFGTPLFPAGYELAVTWPIVFTRSESLIGWVHLAYVAAAALYIYLLTAHLCRDSGWCAAAGLLAVAGCLGIPRLSEVWLNIGKPDVVITGFGVATIYYLFAYADDAAADGRLRPRNLFAAGLSLGLMTGVKNNGVLYAPLAAALIWFADRRPVPFRVRLGAFFRRCVLVFSIMAVLGVFWYVRNILVYGRTMDRHIALEGVRRSIIYNLFTHNPWINDVALWMTFTSPVIGLLLAAVAWRRRARLDYRLAALCSLAAFVVFVITPYSAFGSFAGVDPIQIRLSGPLFPVLVALVLSGLAMILARRVDVATPRPAVAIEFTRPLATASVLLGATAIWLTAAVCQFVFYEPPKGLPEADFVTFHTRRTPVYTFVQRNLKNSRILSYGLRPYGLLGSDFSNNVIYDPQSITLKTEDLDYTLEHNPGLDYLLIARDPHMFQQGLPPSVADLEKRPGFEVFYRDEDVVGFAVPHDVDDVGLPFWNIALEDGWYALQPEPQPGHWQCWSEGRGNVRIFLSRSADARLVGGLWSLRQPNTVDVSLNGATVATLHAPFTLADIPELHFNAGENTLELRSPNPGMPFNQDIRCLNFCLSNLKLAVAGATDVSMTDGWYAREADQRHWWRWSGGRGAVRVFARGAKTASLRCIVHSIRVPNTVTVLLNGEPAATWKIEENSDRRYTIDKLALKKGENLIEFVSELPPDPEPHTTRKLAILVGSLKLTINGTTYSPE